MKLNLKASNKAEEQILEYLEANASGSLAEKINNGVRIEKDGKALISRKDLGGFMNYATEEARKASKSGATSAYIDDDVVFGWAIHYFEEDSIEGKLYNEDGTEYAPPKANKQVSKTATASRSISKPAVSTVTQNSLFDLIASEEKEQEELPTPQTVIDEQNDEQEEILNAIEEEKKKISPFYLEYMEVREKYIDCIVAYRLGDFYEVMGDDAVKLSDELGLTLTSRDCGLESRVPIIGFPYHAADVYFKKIIKKHKVVVLENADNIKLLPAEDEHSTEQQKDNEEQTEASNQLKKPLNDELLNRLKSVLGDFILLR